MIRFSRVDARRCRARFVEENGRWYRCLLIADGHEDHIALFHGKTQHADIRWTRTVYGWHAPRPRSRS